jgi:membrane protein
VNLKSLWKLLKRAGYKAMQDRVPRLGAAVAFYTVLSIAPLLVIATAIAGLIYGENAARGKIVQNLTGYVGKQGAEAIQTMLANARTPSSGVIATIVGVITLLFAATGVFSEIHDAMNKIWEVRLKPGNSILAYLRDRVLSFLMVLGIAFLLLVSLAVSTTLSAIDKFFTGAIVLPGSAQAANFAVSFLIITLLFAMMFRWLPDVKIGWGDVWLGAAFTSLLFNLGKSLIGIYLGRSSVGSAYGASGSLVVLLIWVYYSAQIFFFGAELTRVYADASGRPILPAEGAERIDCEPQSASESRSISNSKSTWKVAAGDASEN